MKRTNYLIEQSVDSGINRSGQSFEAIDHASNKKDANKKFNYYKKIGDTQQHNHFYQTTDLIKEIKDEETGEVEEELLREETWEFVGMKGKRVY